MYNGTKYLKHVTRLATSASEEVHTHSHMNIQTIQEEQKEKNTDQVFVGRWAKGTGCVFMDLK